MKKTSQILSIFVLFVSFILSGQAKAGQYVKVVDCLNNGVVLDRIEGLSFHGVPIDQYQFVVRDPDEINKLRKSGLLDRDYSRAEVIWNFYPINGTKEFFAQGPSRQFGFLKFYLTIANDSTLVLRALDGANKTPVEPFLYSGCFQQ